MCNTNNFGLYYLWKQINRQKEKRKKTQEREKKKEERENDWGCKIEEQKEPHENKNNGKIKLDNR